MVKTKLTVSAIAMLLSSLPVMAETTAPAAAPAEVPAKVDCAADFKTLDSNGDGVLSDTEAATAYARARVDGVTVDANGMTAEAYAEICGADRWQSYAPEEGAPFEGANSFTEEQARDWAVSWLFTDVSALTQDDKGIWRGTAMQGDKSVDIAVDYKGNVVATPKN